MSESVTTTLSTSAKGADIARKKTCERFPRKRMQKAIAIFFQSWMHANLICGIILQQPMVGVSYGKGASLPEGQVRWITGEQLEERIARGESVRIFDCRGVQDHAEASIRGAQSLAQTTLMFNKEKVQALIDELVAGGGAEEAVFFGNTAGEAGYSAGRDVWVIAYLMELGVPLSSMLRLAGGLNQWVKEGRPVNPGRALWSKKVDDVPVLLETAGVPHLAPFVATSTSLAALAAALRDGRPELLRLLKGIGVEKLAERQAISNALAKAVREKAVALPDVGT